jgi:integrase
MDELSFDQFKKAVDEYINKYCARKGLVENTTIRRKREIFKRLTGFLNGKPFNLQTVEAFQDHLAANGWDEPSSRASLASWIRAFVTWGFKYDLFEKNWAFKIVKPKVPRKKWHLMSEENALKTIIAGCEIKPFHNYRIRKAKEEHCLALKFILLHGFRVGEVKAMRGSDLRLASDIPYVRLRKPKSQDEEWLPIHSHFLPILKERINNDSLFRFTEKTTNKLLHEGAKKLGLRGYDNTVHRLRDIYSLSRLRKQPEILVSRTLRHKDLKTTDMHYAHYKMDDLLPVVEDSNVLQSQITPSEFLEKAKKALKTFGLIRPEQYNLRVVEDQNIVRIEVVFPKKKE